nr:MAG TPA: hypothetical protein [Caudoviricetes sp.]
MKDNKANKQSSYYMNLLSEYEASFIVMNEVNDN